MKWMNVVWMEIWIKSICLRSLASVSVVLSHSHNLQITIVIKKLIFHFAHLFGCNYFLIMGMEVQMGVILRLCNVKYWFLGLFILIEVKFDKFLVLIMSLMSFLCYVTSERSPFGNEIVFSQLFCANYQFYSVNFESKLNEINQKFLINFSSIIFHCCIFVLLCRFFLQFT